VLNRVRDPTNTMYGFEFITDR